MDDKSDAAAVLDGLLERWARGERGALDALLTQFYREVHQIAVSQLRGERHSTLRPTALVHEVYLRLTSLPRIKVQDRMHFLAMTARITRQALVDEARKRRSQKRDGGDPVTLTDANLGEFGRVYDAVDLDDLLGELQQVDRLAADIVTLRVFGGLSVDEAAAALGVSSATVNRHWATGKAWLTWELQKP
jgi:RNA polymerase sigma factor (TIGR02999 family)